MSRPPIRLFTASTDSTHNVHESTSERRRTVSVPFGTFASVVTKAMEKNSSWVNDFASDTVKIDSDLYEVILAYQQLEQRKAA